MSSSESRASEIWSTRVQRELVALTSENVEGKNNDIGELPAFLKVKEHTLNIEQGICRVSFLVAIEESVTNSKLGDNNVKPEDTGKEGQEETEKTLQSEEANEESKLNSDTKIKDKEPDTVSITITLDVSRVLDGTDNSDTSQSYPFLKPKAFLAEGSIYLPAGSTVRDSDPIEIDCDWTPSLHLNDAALNIALKIRESIKRSVPFHRQDELEAAMMAVADSVKEGVAVSSAKVSSFFNSLRTKASAMADEMDHAVANSKTKSKTKRRNKNEAKLAIKKKIPTIANLEVGDIIDLSQEPWSQCLGMFPCKPLRKPEFIQADFIEVAVSGKKVAGSGVAGAGSMFKSFTQSAKSLVEESYLMLNEELIIELKCNKFSVQNATVALTIPISNLSKLKFRRQESISLFFKQSSNDPLIYMCDESAEAVKTIQTILKRHGVKGKHTNAIMQKAIETATQNIEEIRVKESAFDVDKNVSIEKVDEIMDLYRQAAEKFELAGDERHEEVMISMRTFLAKPSVAMLLDGNPTHKQKEDSEEKSSQNNAEITSQPEGEVIESLPSNDEEENIEVNDDDDDDDELRKAMQAAEDMLKDAHDDLKDLGIEDDDYDDADLDIDNNAINDTIADSSGHDSVLELEDMLKDADKELAEIMKS
mmetsp:Transcript_4663/g.6612  ORF Transcript_4663/g.6612 Transcript_4663/m.6612 type:complete len:649 (-) Transcript_4663:441-2387(-)|eukprot:CAMPEP_0184864390 /NCGR_PEP_ID=MMETSP0580-20130426/14778_1 /TAXON_ID=1118495 /ORGANISM="Dactyliosolen fragilissimus" /LENGTH=648 /DNA_ID=CAMNT_0027363145 /DNA_START=210 /DNA_END=2156 /DNA_ORIENTATION=-